MILKYFQYLNKIASFKNVVLLFRIVNEITCVPCFVWVGHILCVFGKCCDATKANECRIFVLVDWGWREMVTLKQRNYTSAEEKSLWPLLSPQIRTRQLFSLTFDWHCDVIAVFFLSWLDLTVYRSGRVADEKILLEFHGAAELLYSLSLFHDWGQILNFETLFWKILRVNGQC